MKKHELSGADGEIRFVVLSDPATASLVKNLSDHNNIAIVFININKDGALACEKAEELCVDKSNGNIILCADDTIEHGLEDLFRHISYHDSLIVGSIYDLVAGDDVEKLAEEIEYLTDLDVTIFSKKEGTHPAEYFFEMITLAKKMLPEKEEDQEE